MPGELPAVPWRSRRTGEGASDWKSEEAGDEGGAAKAKTGWAGGAWCTYADADAVWDAVAGGRGGVSPSA